MLQQTQTSRVIEPWRRFVAAFPTASACADASLADVLRLWEGLGYHRRAKALHEAARLIRDEFGGVVPSEVPALRSLPGVGEYTAHAVASFSFGRPVAVLDTNVGRVLARAVENRTLSAREARGVAHALLPRRDVASFNQSMLDLGAQFCRSSPRCDDCPVARVCRWRLEGGADPAPRVSYMRLPHPSGVTFDAQRNRLYIATTRNPNQILEFAPATGILDRRDIPRGPSIAGTLVPMRSWYLPGCTYVHDLAIIDVDTADDPWSLVERLVAQQPPVGSVVVTTVNTSWQMHERAELAGCRAVLDKPYDPGHVFRVLQMV